MGYIHTPASGGLNAAFGGWTTPNTLGSAQTRPRRREARGGWRKPANPLSQSVRHSRSLKAESLRDSLREALTLPPHQAVGSV